LKKADIAIAIFILIGAAFLYHETAAIPEPRFEPLGSAFFPQVILIAMMVLALVQIVQSLFFRPKKEEEKNQIEGKAPARGSAVYIGLTLFLSFAYILSISLSLLNFYVGTSIFIFLLTGFLGSLRIRAWILGLLVAAGLTSMLYLISASLKLILP
jgi:putative tricarboxylic transport membrane protein